MILIISNTISTFLIIGDRRPKYAVRLVERAEIRNTRNAVIPVHVKILKLYSREASIMITKSMTGTKPARLTSASNIPPSRDRMCPGISRCTPDRQVLRVKYFRVRRAYNYSFRRRWRLESSSRRKNADSWDRHQNERQ